MSGCTVHWTTLAENTATPAQGEQVSLIAPASGRQVVSTEGIGVFLVDFDPTAAELSPKGNDLVITFEDGRVLILDDYALNGAPAFKLTNGTIIDGPTLARFVTERAEECEPLEAAPAVFNPQPAQPAPEPVEETALTSGRYAYRDDLGDPVNTFTDIDLNNPDDPFNYNPATFVPEDEDLLGNRRQDLETEFNEENLGQPITGNVPNLNGGDACVALDQSSLENLTSNGEPVIITVDQPAGTITGTTDAGTVFVLTLDEDGSYTYQQDLALDHQGDNGETLPLTFNTIEKLPDEQVVENTLTVKVIDDVPTAVADSASVEENPVAVDGVYSTVSGNLLNNDDSGADTPANVTSITFGDETIMFAEDAAADATITITTDYGTVTVAQDGNYTFNQTTPIPADVDNVIEQLTYTIADVDGDTSSAPLVITITDNETTTPDVVEDTISENNLDTPITGNVPVTEGSTITFAETQPNLNDLTADGTPVIVTVDGNTITGVVEGTNDPVFTVTITEDGNYTFDLDRGIDQDESVLLDIKLTETDNKGRTVTDTLKITVTDSVPVAVDDSNMLEQADKPNASGSYGQVSDNLLTNDTLGADTPTTVTTITFDGTTAPLENGQATLTTDYGTIVVNSDGTYTYNLTKPLPDNTDTLSEMIDYTIVDADGDTSTATLTLNLTDNVIDGQPTVTITTVVETLDGIVATGNLNTNGGQTTLADTQPDNMLTSNGEPVVISQDGNMLTGTTNGETVFTVTINPDGTYKYEQNQGIDQQNTAGDAVNLNLNITEQVGTNTVTNKFTIEIQDAAPIARNDNNQFEQADEPDANGIYGQVSGNILTNDTLSLDMPVDLQSLTFDGTVINFADKMEVSVDTTYGTLTVKTDGSYTFAQTKPIPDGQSSIQEDINYTIVDADDDAATARLRITITNELINSKPIAVDDKNGLEQADMPVDGVYGTVDGNILTNDTLSNDAPTVIQSVTFDGQEFTPDNGFITIETTYGKIDINGDGSYTFTQLTAIPTDAQGLGEVVESLNYTIVDVDGDASTAKLDITITDSVIRVNSKPIAVDDKNSLEQADMPVDGVYGKVDGNILTNDTLSNDAPTVIQSVTFDGQEFTAENGVINIDTVYGKISINADGSYTFTQLTAIPTDAQGLGEVVESLNYTIVDVDGDASTAKLDITITDSVIRVNSKPIAVDDKNGLEQADMPVDGVYGKVDGNILTNDTLSNDAPTVIQSVTFDGQEFTPDNGFITIETTYGKIDINGDGSYTFTQLTAIPTDAQGLGEVVESLNYTIVDVDGDASTAKLDITITDSVTNNQPPQISVCVNGSDNMVNFTFTPFKQAYDDGRDFRDVPDSITDLSKEGTDIEEFYNEAELQDYYSAAEDVVIREGATANIKFVSEGASYKNAVGAFTIDPETGAIKNTALLFGNTSMPNPLQANMSQAVFNSAAGTTSMATTIGIFVMANAFNELKALDFVDSNGVATGNGSLKFVSQNNESEAYIDGVTAGAPKLVHVAENGTVTAIEAPVYHSYNQEQFNPDGLHHAVGGKLSDESDTVRIGFEDLFGDGSKNDVSGRSDRDFNDLVLEFKFSPAYTLDMPCGQLLCDFKLSDDSGKISGAEMTVTNLVAGDKILFHSNVEVVNGNVMIDGKDSGIDATIEYAGSMVNIKFTNEASAELYEDLLQSVCLDNEIDPLGAAGTRDISLTVTDNMGLTSTLTTTHVVEVPDTYQEITGNSNGTLIMGTDDADVIEAESQVDDIVYANGSNDNVSGLSGQDFLYGGNGDDTLLGNGNSDILYGGAGNDIYTGGKGADRFIIGQGVDRITDYNGVDGDKIDLSLILDGSDNKLMNNLEDYIRVNVQDNTIHVDQSGNSNFGEGSIIAKLDHRPANDVVNIVIDDMELQATGDVMFTG